MTWEGPEPHDFRDMKAREVRFVNSGLFYKMSDSGEDYALDRKILFKVLVGDEVEGKRICEAIADLGVEWIKIDPGEYYSTIQFEVAVNSAI